MTTNAGILGIGVHLPKEIRRNDFWPESILSRWREKAMHRVEAPATAASEGVQRALAGMSRYKGDLFNGAVERRVMGENETSSQMETAAAREAIERSGVDPMDIDAVITFSVCPDFLCGPTGCLVHRGLALSGRCLTFNLDAACNSFNTQLTLADQMIRSGDFRHVLLTQSAAFSRLIPVESPLSPWLGDGATAVVVGRVGRDHGVLGHEHGTDGRRYGAVVHGIPGKHWYEEGRVVCYSEDREQAQAMILGSIDRAKQVIPPLLARTGFTAAQVDFYACHQGVPWLREVSQEAVGMTRARWIDTYASFGSIGGANIPLVLASAEREGALRPGDLVATFSGGAGETCSAALLRWGRG
jgi:3-oxoacyl-[acyl-carrier-protein] synthase-3